MKLAHVSVKPFIKRKTYALFYFYSIRVSSLETSVTACLVIIPHGVFFNSKEF
jgi:hypothetical protein